MKTTILFIVLASTLLHHPIPPKAIVFSHSNYKNQNGVACVWYNKKLYSMKWFGIDTINKKKRWEIIEVDECEIGDPNSGFKNVINNPVKATDEIQIQLSKIGKVLRHPE